MRDGVSTSTFILSNRSFPYLQHLLNSVGLDRAIFVDVATEDDVSVVRFVPFFVGLVVPQLLEDRLGNVGVEVVDKNVFRHKLKRFSNYL